MGRASARHRRAATGQCDAAATRMKTEPKPKPDQYWQELVEQLSALSPAEAEPIWFGEAEEALLARDTNGLGVCLEHSHLVRQLVSDILCGKSREWRLNIIQNFIGRPRKAKTIVDGLFIGEEIDDLGGKQEAGIATVIERGRPISR